MRSTLAIDIEAPPRFVFDLARDVERWPRLLPHYLDVRILEREPGGAVTARMLAVRAIVPRFGFGMPVAWRARTWAEEADLRLRFVHLGGATGGMDVTWRIEATPAGCRVSIDHDFEPRIPGWSALITRLFVQPIATRTLATFKAIAETVAAATAQHATPSESPATPKAKAARSSRARPSKKAT
jgi:ribosome-associated toxin RatA of RatAB toxin-antitoxin module